VQAALAGAERVFAVLELPTDRPATTAPSADPATPGPAPARRPASRETPAVLLREVTFGYEPGRPVLDRVDLAVPPGRHVAVVGRTGAGKSTILSLAAGLYIPWSGSIRLADTDPSRLDDHSRRALIGYVPQTVDLFSGTVTENITVGDPTISRAQVQRAAHIAGADTFITALPDGYDTELADTGRGRGVQLSAGQRQLLALARALVTAPAVLLLDEATSVVDGASDAAFRRALHERVLPGGTAVLTVAHRLATARQADHVLLIDDGRVVEQGAPGALLGTRSRFADLVALDDAGWDWQDDAAAQEADTRDRPVLGQG
jgi:ATP-binding cassette subfamily B multidrug efflux pump